jgi:5-formyltetrahydrofolate cyclo-ligase
MNPNPKIVAREQALRRIAKLAPAWIETASDRIAARVLDLPAIRAAKRVGCYVALRNEVQTASLLASLNAAGKETAVPAWNTTRSCYQFSAWQPGEALLSGPHGALEPAWPRWVDVGSLDVILVPVVAFDRFLRRLGHGGGNFDRLLSGHTGARIGLAFEAQRIAAVPVEEHDVELLAVATEARVYDANTPWAAMIEAATDQLAQRKPS